MIFDVIFAVIDGFSPLNSEVIARDSLIDAVDVWTGRGVISGLTLTDALETLAVLLLAAQSYDRR